MSDSVGVRRRIGIDFDNTIIDYDEVFLTVAKQRGLIRADFDGPKLMVRNEIRQIPDGEKQWMEVQGYVYGKGISGARLYWGVDRFLAMCRQKACEVFIVSHKTQYGHFDPDRVDLRQAAFTWMTERGLFDPNGYAISPQNVFFEGTREEKVERIRWVRCEVFIDDLAEVFLEPDFPPGVKRILLSSRAPEAASGVEVCATWREVENAVFG